MDRMYRVQRHIYDLTRKFYLLGRDRLIAELEPPRGGHVLEIGCGTGRNLIALARRYPTARLYGLDAAQVMLDTAAANIARAGLSDRIRLAQGLAQDLAPGPTFGLDRRFDAIVISYALTMIPDWRGVAEHALAHLRPGGVLAVVDFWDQRDLPPWFGGLLRRWLHLFDVAPQSDMPDYLAGLAQQRGGRATVQPVCGGYAFRATLSTAA